MISINPYEILNININSDSSEIGEHHEMLIKYLESGVFDKLYAYIEKIKLSAAVECLCNSSEKAIIDSKLTKEDKKRITKNANLFRKALRMNRILKNSIGKEVIVCYSCHEFMDFEKGKLKSVKEFDEVVVGRLHIPFISPEVVISRIIDAETDEVLYFNSNIKYKKRKMNKTEVSNIISASWGKSTAERQMNTKKMMNMLDRKSDLEIFLKMSKLMQDSSSENYKRFIEENEISAAELAYCGSSFREYWDNYSDQDTSYTMKPRENNDSEL